MPMIIQSYLTTLPLSMYRSNALIYGNFSPNNHIIDYQRPRIIYEIASNDPTHVRVPKHKLLYGVKLAFYIKNGHFYRLLKD